MSVQIYDELQLFGVCILLGMSIAFTYDLFRVFRLLIKHRDLFVDLEDLLFWLGTAWFVFRTLFFYNQGALRGYAFLGMFLGMIAYVITISRLVMKLAHAILPYWNKMKQIIQKPFVAFLEETRKILKNTILDVKMAVKGR